MAEMLNDPETGYSALKELASRDLKTARGIVNTIKATYSKLKMRFSDSVGKYYGKKIYLSKYERAINLFEKAVRDGAKNRSEQIYNTVSYSISKNFNSDYDNWVKNGRPHRESLVVGKTSSALKSIGVKEQNITWDTSKINDSLNKHKYLNDTILKQIPNILENPIIVMQSKQSDSRITMFGEVYDGDGIPVMAVLELLPTNRNNTVVLDEIKLVTSHSRK